MRTKALLAVAALAIAIPASAQVYSANVVGYVNYKLTGGGAYNLIANPLNNSNNNITNLFPASVMKEGVSIMRWDVATYDFQANIPTFSAFTGQWSSNFDLKPGEGVFVVNPDVDINVTYVGEVIQGNYTNNLVGGGAYNALGSSAPLGGSFQNAIAGLAPAEGDSVMKWDVATYDFNPTIPTYSAFTSTWAGSVDLAVGEGFFYVRNGGDIQWVRNFTVAP